MKAKIIIGITVTLLLVGVGGYFGLKWSYENKDVRLVEQVEASISDSKSHYTKMKEIIYGTANVAKKYDKTFQKQYEMIMSGRANDKLLMKWLQESNPNYSTNLLENVQRQIVAQRESFHNNQTQLIDRNRQLNVLRKSKPFGVYFLGDREPIDIPVIITDETQNVFETGIEKSNQDLF